MSDQHIQHALDHMWEYVIESDGEMPLLLEQEYRAVFVPMLRAWLDSVGLTARWCENQEVEYAERYRKTRNAHDRMSAELLGKLSAAIRAVQL